MAHLTHVRQRMRAIETIKKITHAMRLISMSTHSKLQRHKKNLKQYKQAFKDLYNKVIGVASSVKVDNKNKKSLIILIGSQKGLCGNFNSQLFKYFEKQDNQNLDIITVGKYAFDYAKSIDIKLLKSFNKFTQNNFVEIANDITDFLLFHEYNKIILYSNYSKSFFLQLSKTTIIEIDSNNEINKNSAQDYIIEGSQSDLVENIKKNMLAISIQEVLFESLLSEQAARFLSMDTATRNASSLLEEMSRTYNKLRQAYITQELSELVSSY